MKLLLDLVRSFQNLDPITVKAYRALSSAATAAVILKSHKTFRRPVQEIVQETYFRKSLNYEVRTMDYRRRLVSAPAAGRMRETRNLQISSGGTFRFNAHSLLCENARAQLKETLTFLRSAVTTSSTARRRKTMMIMSWPRTRAEYRMQRAEYFRSNFPVEIGILTGGVLAGNSPSDNFEEVLLDLCDLLAVESWISAASVNFRNFSRFYRCPREKCGGTDKIIKKLVDICFGNGRLSKV